MTTVLLADDQELVRAGFRLIFELAQFAVVGEASDGAAALDMARQLEPDVALMDVRMPGMDGIEATRRIGLAGLRTRAAAARHQPRHGQDPRPPRAGQARPARPRPGRGAGVRSGLVMPGA